MVDAAGNHFVNSSQTVPMIASAANASIFVVSDASVRDGTVGGDVISFATQSRIAGEMAVKILSGEKASNIPIEQDASTYLFDWNALSKWNLKESALPPNSELLNRQPSAWDSYKWFIMGGLAIILTELILILALLWNRRLRRNAEAQFAVLNEWFRLAVEAGKAVGWDVDYKNHRNEWFGDLESMFGIQSGTFTAGMGDFRNQIYPDDRGIVERAIDRARENHTTYSEDFRIVRKDGTIRWITATGRFFYSAGDTAERMLGMAVDITDRKLAAEALSHLSGQLIAVQEEERSRIAREIHDDYQQRLAVIAFNINSLAATLQKTGTGDETNQATQLSDLAEMVQALGIDLHSLSHRLHPSILENLGLVATVESFCEEFSIQQKIDVSFTSQNVPRPMPADISLCLYRVVQEALRNVKKHSGSKSAEVRLEGLGNCIHLAVFDQGNGFVVSPSSKSGIGIRSMEERLRLVGGSLRVSSTPGNGTKLDAYVPLTA
jgi:PAS domain S-box-containing protein